MLFSVEDRKHPADLGSSFRFIRLCPAFVPTLTGVPSADASCAVCLPQVVELPDSDRQEDVSGQQDELPLARRAHALYGSVTTPLVLSGARSKTDLPYSLAAGITYLYTLWNVALGNIDDPPSLSESMMDIQSCSSVLQALSCQSSLSTSILDRD